MRGPRLHAVLLLTSLTALGCAAPADRATAAGCYRLAWYRPGGAPDGGFFPPRLTLTDGPDSGRVVPREQGGDSSRHWIGVSTWRQVSRDSLEIRLSVLDMNGASVSLRQIGDSVDGSAILANEFIDSSPPTRFAVRGARTSCGEAAGGAG